MANLATGSVARQLGSLFEGGTAAGLSDRQLIDRFATSRDEAAFAALVARHGPMVLGVCRQLLGDQHHAEDAFQAVFLVLARRARSIRDPDLLGNWLYGVALRTARCARNRIALRRKSEEIGTMTRPGPDAPAEPTTPPAEETVAAREHAEALHVEIERLPEAFRLPVVLCYLEGLTVHEAARRLRWSHGTVRSRMARAREKLRRALVRRGVVLPAAALAAVLDARSAPASASSPLCDITTRAAIQFAAGPAAGEALSASTAALAQEVLRSMLFHKLKLAALGVVLLGAVATGVVSLSPGALAQPRRGEATAEPRPGSARREARPPDGAPVLQPSSATPGRMTVAGRVLDPSGKPLAGAEVDIVGRPRRSLMAADAPIDRVVLLGRGTTEADGRFQLDAERTSSEGFFSVYALAAARGFGLGWVELNADSARPAPELRLRPEQPLRGRLVDIAGRPADGVELRVDQVGVPGDATLLESISIGDALPEGVRAWPGPVKTDDRGRFVIPGIGRGLRILLITRDPRFAPQWLVIEHADRDNPGEIARALEPPTPIEGRVLAADTGQPIPGAVIEIGAIRTARNNGMAVMKVWADAQGRFRAIPFPGDRFQVGAFATGGLPYRSGRVEFDWPKGAVKKEVDVRLPRGVLIRGRVTEQGTGRPLPGASIQPMSMKGPDGEASCGQTVTTGDDGTYGVVVPPGKGHLLVFGPTHDYILEVVGQQMLTYGQPDGERNYAHKIIPYEARAGDPPHDVEAALRPGQTIRGRVIDPDGRPVAHASMITRLYIEPFNPFWRGHASFQPHARDGRFELHGLDPEASAPVYFLDFDHEWGATLEASGKLAGEDLTIRLQPCGRARARLVGPDGKPVAKVQPTMEIVVTPGATAGGRDPGDRGKLLADAAWLSTVDPKHYRFKQRPLADAEGHITLPDLIPGASYRIMDGSDPSKGVQLRKAFTVRPGETVDLGEIRINKPPT